MQDYLRRVSASKSCDQNMQKAAAVTRAPPPPVTIPDTVATDDDEGDTGANTLLASEAFRTSRSSQRSSADNDVPQPSHHQRTSLDEVVVLPDSPSATARSDSLPDRSPVESQPLLQWRQSSPPHRLQRRQSEMQLTPSKKIQGDLHRSMSDTADTGSNAGSQAVSFSRDTSQPFYGVEARRPVRRDLSSKLLNNMHRSMHAPSRQRSLLSRISPPILDAEQRRRSSDHESAVSMPEMIEMSALSRIASEGPESSSGSILVEVSPDSYEPLSASVWDPPSISNQLPVTLEEESEVN